MSDFDKTDPDVWRKRTGGGCLVLFGLPFLLMGLALILGFIRPEDGKPVYLSALFGLPFALVGAGLIFGRYYTTIDRRSMKLIKSTRLIIELKRKEFSLSRFSRVTLTKELRTSKNSSYYVWPIKVAGEAGVEAITIDAPRSAEDGRTDAEELSRFLDLPLHDSTVGETRVREVGSLDESLRERMYKDGKRVELPDRPALMKSVITDGLEGPVIDIPGPGLNPIMFLALVLPLGFSALTYHFFLRNLIKGWPPKDSTELIFAGFFLFFFIFVPFATTLIGIFSRAKKRSKVTVSSAMLRVETRWLVRSKTVEIPSEELEELLFEKSSGKMAARRLARGMPSIGGPITARSDKANVSFGQELTDEELAYIYALIKKRITE